MRLTYQELKARKIDYYELLKKAYAKFNELAVFCPPKLEKKTKDATASYYLYMLIAKISGNVYEDEDKAFIELLQEYSRKMPVVMKRAKRLLKELLG